MNFKKVKIAIFVLFGIVFTAAIFCTIVLFIEKEKVEGINVYAAVQDGTYSSGSGTSADPYIIKTTTQLNKLASNVNSGSWSMPGNKKYWKLGNDIDFDFENFTPIGYLYPFYGHLDGGGFTISNVKIEINDGWYGSVNSQIGVGIIGKLLPGSDGAYVKNLAVDYLSMTVSSGKTLEYLTMDVGGIVGSAEGSVSIENCDVRDVWLNVFGKLEVDVTTLGGVVGFTDSTTTTIENCYVNGPYFTFKESYYDAGSKADWAKIYVSGITLDYAKITDCYVKFRGAVTNIDVDKVTEYEISRPKSVSSMTNCYSSEQSSYNFGSISADKGPTGSVWYFQDVNKVPLLRTFINWHKIQVVSSGGGTVSPTTPFWVTYEYGLSDRYKTNQELAIDVYTVKAVPSSGYNFSSWDYAINESKKEITLTASFIPIEYTIKIYHNDGGADYTTLNYNITTSVNLKNNVSVNRYGYDIAGFSESITGSAQNITVGPGVIGDKTYYIIWTEKVYTLTCALNNNTTKEETTQHVVKYGWSVEFDLNTSKTSISVKIYDLNDICQDTIVYDLKDIYKASSYIANIQDFIVQSNSEVNVEVKTRKFNVEFNKTDNATLEFCGEQVDKVVESVEFGSVVGLVCEKSRGVYRQIYSVNGKNIIYTIDIAYLIENVKVVLKNDNKGKTYSQTSSILNLQPKTNANFVLVEESAIIEPQTSKKMFEITFKLVDESVLIVDNVEKNSDYVISVEYGKVVTTEINKATNEYSYIVNGVKIKYKVTSITKWVMYFNLPNQTDGMMSTDLPSWQVDDNDIEQELVLELAPSIELKIYEGELA